MSDMSLSMQQGSTPGMHGFQGQTPGRMNQGGFGGNTAGTHAGLTGIQQQVLQSIFCCVVTTQHFKVISNYLLKAQEKSHVQGVTGLVQDFFSQSPSIAIVAILQTLLTVI